MLDAKYIMFVDALSGVVSPDGADCVTKTHILIRADYGGGIHPGQWRVGGEASFGWGGKCHMCTSHQGGDCTVLIPFDVLCHKPSLPSGCSLKYKKSENRYFMGVGPEGITEMEEEEEEEKEEEGTEDEYTNGEEDGDDEEEEDEEEDDEYLREASFYSEDDDDGYMY